MTIQEAREIARKWVLEEGCHMPGFYGAFFHGSMNDLPANTPLSPTSDVDVMVVLDDPNIPVKPGKFRYMDVLLEVSTLSQERVSSPERVLGDYHLASSFRTPAIILDPSGELTSLQAAVGRDFARRPWVIRRCEHARDLVLQRLEGWNETVPFHDLVTAWLFATGVMPHVLLVAGLKNPTVRRRYAAVRELLAEHGYLDLYESLLGLLGCAEMSRARVEEHLTALTEVFDATGAVLQTPFFFASDLSAVARPIAIDGSREMIEGGYHREAIFWIAATYSRCQKALAQDGTAEMRDRFDPGYRRLLSDLGIASFADLARRGEEVRTFLPHVWEVAETILTTNPEITV